jgi:hypothetical protein
VEQQAKALLHETSLSVAPFMGSCTPPSTFDVLVSTPGAFIGLNELDHPGFRYSDFDLIVFDEVRWCTMMASKIMLNYGGA